jgi:ribosome-binding ATPase YchF (GTP1/OBG family)
MMDSNNQYLKLNSKTKTLELECEILQKDKNTLLSELDTLKAQERKLNELWEEKLERSESSHHKKILMVQESCELEIQTRDKKAHDKVQKAEEEKQVLEKV